MNKRKLAVIVSCLLLHSGFWSVAGAEEAANPDSDTEPEEVVVTADKLKELNPAKITVIDEALIKAQGAHNVAEALRDVPGMNVTSNNGLGKSIAMFRGSDAENTKVYVDGVPLSPVVDGKVDLSAISTDSIAKIEVIKGAAPVIYGANAPGGVILITTKKGGSTSSSSLTATTGSYRDRSLSAATSGRIDSLRTSYFLNVKRELSDGFTANTKLKENSIDGNLLYDINSKSSVTLLGGYTIKYEQLSNRINPATGQILTLDSSTTMGKTGIFKNLYNFEYTPLVDKYMAMVYNKKVSDNSDLSLKLYRSNESSFLRGFGNFGDNPTWVHDNRFGSIRGLEAQNTYRTSRANTIIAGYNWEHRSFYEVSDAVATIDTEKKLPAQGTDGGSYYSTSRSLYLQNNLNVSKKLAVSFGIRHDVIDDNADTASWNDEFYGGTKQYHYVGKGSPTKPEASFSYAMTGRTTLHGAFSETYRWPNPTESLHPGGIFGAYGTEYWLLSDPITGKGYVDSQGSQYYVQWYKWPDGTWHQTTTCERVLPEEAINREIGLSHSFPFGLKLDCTYFYKNIENMIKGQTNVASFDPSSNSCYYNIPNVQMHGYEVEGNYPLGKQVKGFLNYSYINAYDPVGRCQVSDIPYRKYSFGFIYTGHNGLNAYLALNYLGSYNSVYSTGNGNNNGDANKSGWTSLAAAQMTVPAYRTMDLKVSKQKDNREYYFKISNLLDKKYYRGCFLLAPGRSVEIGGTVKF